VSVSLRMLKLAYPMIRRSNSALAMKRITAVLLLVLGLAAFSLMVTPSHASMSMIRGTVYWYDMYGNLRPLPWAQVVAEGNSGEPATVSTTTDGTYMMWVAPGSYNLTVSVDPAYTPASKTVTVSAGGIAEADFELQPSGKPIPEYPSFAQPVMLLIAALAATVLIRRRNHVRSQADEHSLGSPQTHAILDRGRSMGLILALKTAQRGNTIYSPLQ
jgi:hypothetical protein